MFITSMNIENFGPFADRELSDLAPGLNVIHGPNEAGKSALRAFVRTVLFGFLDRRQREFDFYNYPPERGGEASGSISFGTVAGGSYTARRIEGTRGGPVEVRGSQSGGGELLDSLLGRISAEVYQNIFSVSLFELQRLDLLSDDQVRDQLNSTSLGLGGVNMAKRFQELEAERSSRKGLWSPGAGRLREGLRKRNERRVALQQARNELSSYGELTSEIARLEQELAKITATVGAAREQLEQMNSLDRLRADAAGLARDLSDGDLDDRERESRIAREPVVAGFSGKELLIRELLGTREQYAKAVKDLPRLEEEEAKGERALMDGLSGLGTGWDEVRLKAFVEIEASRAELTRVAEEVESTETLHRDRAGEFTRRRESLQETKGLLSEAEAKLRAFGDLPGATVDQIESERDRLTNLKMALTEVESLEGRAESSDASLPDRVTALGRWAGAALAVVGAAGLAWGLVSAELSGLVFGVAFVFVGGALAAREILRRREPRGAAILDLAEASAKRLMKARCDVGEIAGELGLAGTLAARDIIEREGGLTRERERRVEFDKLAGRVSQIGLDTDRLAKEVEEAERESEAAAGALEDARQAWRECLSRYALQPSLDALGAIAALERIATLHVELRNLDTTRFRITQIEKTVDKIEGRLLPLLAEMQIEPIEHLRGKQALDELGKRFESHLAAVARRESLGEERVKWPIKREKLERDHSSLEDEVSDLVFALRDRTNRIATKETESSERKMNLECAQDELLPEAVEARRQALDEEIERHQSGAEEVRKKLWDVEGRRRMLEESNPVAEIHDDLSRIEQQVDDDARRWAVLTIAGHVLESTRDEFQRERQTPLLQTARAHFREFSLGRYEQVTAVLGEDRIEVEDHPGRAKDVAALSRGTAEQLFLALRLAMVREYSRTSEPMPVLMDDVTVNFDPKRAMAVFRVLVELSATHQVLVLTCHPSTVSQLEEASNLASAEAPKVIRL